MEDDDTPDSANKMAIQDKEFEANGLARDEMHQITQHIRVLSMQMQRYKPQEWNEFLIVALDSWNSSSYPLKDWTIKVKNSNNHNLYTLIQ